MSHFRAEPIHTRINFFVNGDIKTRLTRNDITPLFYSLEVCLKESPILKMGLLRGIDGSKNNKSMFDYGSDPIKLYLIPTVFVPIFNHKITILGSTICVCEASKIDRKTASVFCPIF